MIPFVSHGIAESSTWKRVEHEPITIHRTIFRHRCFSVVEGQDFFGRVRLLKVRSTILPSLHCGRNCVLYTWFKGGCKQFGIKCHHEKEKDLDAFLHFDYPRSPDYQPDPDYQFIAEGFEPWAIDFERHGSRSRFWNVHAG